LAGGHRPPTPCRMRAKVTSAFHRQGGLHVTDCSEQLTFSFHPCKDVVADCAGGLISSDAGLLPLRELDERLGWTAAVAEQLADSREAAKVRHQRLMQLRQRLFGLVGGYPDANDHTRLSHDPILKTVSGVELNEGLASQPTLSRFENAATARQVAMLNRQPAFTACGQPLRRRQNGTQYRFLWSARGLCPCTSFRMASCRITSYSTDNLHLPADCSCRRSYDRHIWDLTSSIYGRSRPRALISGLLALCYPRVFVA